MDRMSHPKGSHFRAFRGSRRREPERVSLDAASSGLTAAGANRLSAAYDQLSAERSRASRYRGMAITDTSHINNTALRRARATWLSIATAKEAPRGTPGHALNLAPVESGEYMRLPDTVGRVTARLLFRTTSSR